MVVLFFYLLLVSRMFPRWNVVECDTMANVWALMSLPMVTRSTPHTPAQSEMKTSWQKRMCDFLLESVPNKNMVLCSPGERVNGSCGMRPGLVDQLADKQGCGILHPEIWRQAVSGPPCHLLALNHRVRLRICRAIQCPADTARPAVYSPSEWSSAFRKINNVPWERERDNERSQVSNSYWECENQERPGRSQQQPSLVSKDVEIKCQFLISNLQFSSLCCKIRFVTFKLQFPSINKKNQCKKFM